MNILLFFIVLSCFSILFTIIGFIASKNIKTTTDYFLAGRNLEFFPLMFTLIATQLGGGMLLGTSQEAFSIGLYGIAYTIGISIGFLLLGCGFAETLQSLNIATTAELFETKYHSSALKKIASLLSIITMSGILIGQIVGSKILISGLGIKNELFFIIFWLLTITYTMVGGLHAVVITDLFQVIFIIIIFGTIFTYSLFLNPESFIKMITMQRYFTPAYINYADLIATITMPALFALIEQDLAQRFFAARTKRIAALSAFGASLFMILFAIIPIYFGMQAQISGLQIATGASPLIPFLSTIVNDFILALAVCGIIAAISSTADSLLCAISSNLAQDFDFSFLQSTPLQRSHYITLFIGVSALLLSYIAPSNIIQILIGSYEISVSCLLVPLLFAYFSKKVEKEAAYGAIIVGFFSFISFRLWWPFWIPREIITPFLSLIGYYIGNSIAILKK